MGSPPKQAGGGKEIKSSNASEQILQGQQKQIYLSTNLYGSLKRRRRARMVASTIVMMVSPNSMIELGGHHVFLFLIYAISHKNLPG